MRTNFSGWVRREVTEAEGLLRRIADAPPQDAVIHAVTLPGGPGSAWVVQRGHVIVPQVWRPTAVEAIEAVLP